MRRSAKPFSDKNTRVCFWMLAFFLVVLWFAGGASRADVSGQIITRFFAWTLLVIYVLLGLKKDWRTAKPVAIIIGLSTIVVLLQLIPLPPKVWTALPGRTLLSDTAIVAGLAQPWRPISISPGATINALGSLIVPIVTFILAMGLTRDHYWRITNLLLGMIVAGGMVGLLQFSGAQFDNPFINDVTGSVSGNFANRNHFALFIAFGCILAPIWGFRGKHGVRWKAILSLLLLPFFLMIILATGSRMGVLVGILAIGSGLLIVWSNMKQELDLFPRPVAIGIVVSMVGVLLLAVASSFVFGRALSFDRALNLGMGEELRTQVLPFITDAAASYFPIGAGFGTFDAAYRIVEPDAMLHYAYLNHAHNDWVEILLDGGLFAVLLLGYALWWWLSAALKLNTIQNGQSLGKGSAAIVLLVLIASITDYPARTPMVMAVLTLAGVWLSQAICQSRPEGGDFT